VRDIGKVGKVMTVQEAMDALAQFGYRECTEKTKKQNGEHFQSLYAFEEPDGDGLYYYCDTEMRFLLC
jgi:hypothetical protein